MRKLAVALLLALAAQPAMAHGASVEIAKDEGPYRVVFYTFEFLNEGEQVRLAWNVTGRASGERVRVDDPKVDVVAYDERGLAVNRTTVALAQRVDGFLFGDFTMGPVGRMTFTLPLPEATITFENTVYPVSTAGRNTPSSKTPLHPGLACAALAIAALASGRRG